jgi:tetratricopeptide (TPR) repeat protein
LVELDPESSSYLNNLAQDYAKLGEYDKASELASKAFILKSDDCDIAFGYGRILFLIEDYKKANIMLKKSYNMKNSKDLHGIIWGNLGHIALFDNNMESAIEYYQKSVREFDDINDFSEKFDTDLPYALKNGISKTKYEEIKQNMVEYWQENN